MIFSAVIGERGAALRAEHAIKQLEKPQKEALVKGALACARACYDDCTTSDAAEPTYSATVRTTRLSDSSTIELGLNVVQPGSSDSGSELTITDPACTVSTILHTPSSQM